MKHFFGLTCCEGFFLDSLVVKDFFGLTCCEGYFLDSLVVKDFFDSLVVKDGLKRHPPDWNRIALLSPGGGVGSIFTFFIFTFLCIFYDDLGQFFVLVFFMITCNSLAGTFFD